MNGNVNNHVVVPYKMFFRIFQASPGVMAPFPKGSAEVPLSAVKYLELRLI
jgi:hypothetical protein